MKKTTLILSTALLLTTLQPSYAATDFKQMFIIKAVMRLLDVNKNQQIEIDEVESRWGQAFNMTDKNADKVLTLDEFNALFQARSAQVKLLDPESKLPSTEAAFKELDLNDNKKVTLWEFNTHAINQFRLVDTDDDDAISQDEMLAVKGRLPF